MPPNAAAPAGILADDRLPLRPALVAALRDSGLAVAGVATGVRELTGLLGGSPTVTVAVVNVAVLGRAGLHGLDRIRALAPGCTLVLLTPFAALREEALAAGADAVVGEDDLTGLRRALRQTVAAVGPRNAGTDGGRSTTKAPS